MTSRTQFIFLAIVGMVLFAILGHQRQHVKALERTLRDAEVASPTTGGRLLLPEAPNGSASTGAAGAPDFAEAKANAMEKLNAALTEPGWAPIEHEGISLGSAVIAPPGIDPTDLIYGRTGKLSLAFNPELKATLAKLPAEALRELYSDAATFSDPAAAAELFQDAILRSLADRDPGFVTRNARPTSNLIFENLPLWAASDPGAASDWFKSAPLPEEQGEFYRDQLLRKLVSGLARTDPAAAIRAATTFAGEFDPSRDEVFEQIGRNVEGADQRASFLATAANLPPENRTAAVAALAEGAVFRDGFDRASSQVEGNVSNEYILALATASLDNRADVKADWLVRASSIEHRAENVRRLVADWAREDFNAVAAWMGTKVPHPDFDPAVGEFVALTRDLDPDSSAQWAKMISGAE